MRPDSTVRWARSARSCSPPWRSRRAAGAAATRSRSLNPFDKDETYKPEIIPDVPAEQLYNEGLGYLQKNDYEGAAKNFARPRQAVSVLGLGRRRR